MGVFRLLLALAVLLSHAGLRVGWLNPGVTAVIGFYLLSGYVMAGLLERHYRQPGRFPLFWIDRLARIYPQYLLVAAVTLVWQVVSGRQTLFLNGTPGCQELFNNLLIMPLNYFMVNGSDAYVLIPPAWSLGAELQFYLLVPFLFLWPWLGLGLTLSSLGVHALAWAGVLHPDWFGYRLLPGVLWVFMAGGFVYLGQRAARGWIRWTTGLMAALAPLGAWLVFRVLVHFDWHRAPFHQEVLWGWGLGIPILYGLSRLRRAGWDERIGDLAYGVFLNHFLLIWLLDLPEKPTPVQLMGLCVASVALSALTQRWVERPVLDWRHRLRRRPVDPS